MVLLADREAKWLAGGEWFSKAQAELRGAEVQQEPAENSEEA